MSEQEIRQCTQCKRTIPADYPQDVTCGACDGEIGPYPCTLLRYGCGCIGFTGADGQPVILQCCDGDGDGYGIGYRAIDPANLPGVPLTGGEVYTFLVPIMDLASEGRAARDLIASIELLQRLQARRSR